MIDPDRRGEVLKEYEKWFAKVNSPEGRARLLARGVDPDAELTKLTALKETFLAANDECEKAQEELLQKGADVADASYEVYKALRRLVEDYKRVNPLDPRLDEWEDQLEAWAEHMPKERASTSAICSTTPRPGASQSTLIRERMCCVRSTWRAERLVRSAEQTPCSGTRGTIAAVRLLKAFIRSQLRLRRLVIRIGRRL